MDEIKVITDRVTVMRDGTYVGTLITKECTKNDIINMMVGRVIYEDPKTHSMVPKGSPVVLKVENLNAGKMVQNVSFELHKGEILGFSGLMGAGRTEFAMSLFGHSYGQKISGEVYMHGKKISTKTVKDAIDNKIAYTSEDRKTYGLVLINDIKTNMTMAAMRDYYSHGQIVDEKKENLDAEEYKAKINVKATSIHQTVGSLSGGN